ncbi:hypothetical protein M3610_27195 [Neobacillus sp. MER 74]|uniref:hypothetical protein n=1 Tax=Neobacillus sp. MER 74 TaxID=2939566 RepID=UPI00203B4734|nr:hypothetical protein [Neobacillus sp. MER 74]MCM3118863.1 hypothetical protein [Neobacillus sp. MER 74]
MEKQWLVECWGYLGDTDLFYTEKEARTFFNSIRKRLDSSKYIITKTSIINKENSENAVYLTNLREKPNKNE